MTRIQKPLTLQRTLLLVLAAAGLPSAAAAEPSAAAAAPAASVHSEDALPPDANLTGQEIYERTLRNRLDAYVQETRLVSGDRGGAEQQTQLVVRFKSFRDDEDRAVNGTFSKTVLEYTQPFDVRGTTYLIIHNDGQPNDQFVYLPSFRRVRRVNLRGESVFGSDFSYEDVVPRELHDSTYVRKPDELVDGIACYAVEATPKPETKSEYSRFVFYVEKERYVPLRIRYWDENGVEFKRLEAEHASIQRFDAAWIPTRSLMRNILSESYSRLFIERLEPNVELGARTFSLRHLEGR